MTEEEENKMLFGRATLDPKKNVKYQNPCETRTKQSDFVKYNLYNIDSDDDELDFLDKNLDLEKRD